MHLRASLPLRCSGIKAHFSRTRHHFTGEFGANAARITACHLFPAAQRQFSGSFKRSGGVNGRADPINVGFDYLSAYREVAGARGTARHETSRDGVREEGAHAKYFPFKAERDRGGEEEIKKRKGRKSEGREREGAGLKKTERCHPVDSDTEAEPRTAADRERSSRGTSPTQLRGSEADAAALSEL